MPPAIIQLNISRSTGLWEHGYYSASLNADGVVACEGPAGPPGGKSRIWRLRDERMHELATYVSSSGIFEHVPPEEPLMHDATYVSLEIAMSDGRRCAFPSQQASHLLSDMAEAIARHLEVYG